MYLWVHIIKSDPDMDEFTDRMFASVLDDCCAGELWLSVTIHLSFIINDILSQVVITVRNVMCSVLVSLFGKFLHGGNHLRI